MDELIGSPESNTAGSGAIEPAAPVSSAERDIELLAEIGAVEKNGRGEMIRVRIVRWKGHACIDARVFVPSKGGGETATRKGLAIPLRHAPAVLELLVSAVEEARHLGLLAPTAVSSHSASPSRVSPSRERRDETRQAAMMRQAHQLRDEGLKPAEIAARLGVGRATAYRLLKAAAPQEPQGEAP